jgi:hypothetical protein
MSKISLWDDPSDYDDNSDKPAKKKKLSWWQEFERADDGPKQEKEAADPYSYRAAFDDTDDSWHRRNKFTHSHYRDYSPSRLFRSAFSGIGFWSAQHETGETSAINALNNKVIRALRVLTRNVNTVADKAAKITYEVHVSSGIDANQSVAHYVEGSAGKHRKQVIFISPDEIEAAKTPDADDAVIDALTGFVLLRVQIAQSVPKYLLDNINETGKAMLPAKIITLATESRRLTKTDLAEKATEYTDNYLAGAIAKNLLVRLARRGVVQDWGGFSPYFVRHAKKFAATRESLTDEKEPDSVERLVMRIAYNLIDDENQIPLAAEVNKIVDTHLSAELDHDDILPACKALVADLRAYWVSTLPEGEAASPPLGKIEEALAKLFKDFSSKKERGSSKAEHGAGDDDEDDDADDDDEDAEYDEDEADTENILNELLKLFDSLNEIEAQYTHANKFADSLAAIEKEIKAAKELDSKSGTAAALTAVAEHCKASSEPRQVWLSVETATKNIRATVPEHINKSIDALLDKLADKAMTTMSPDIAAEFSKEITNVSNELRAAIKQDFETSRDAIKKMVTDLAALAGEKIAQLRDAAKKSAELAEKATEGVGPFGSSKTAIAGLTAAEIEAELTYSADDTATRVTTLADTTATNKARSAAGLRKMLQAARALLDNIAGGEPNAASKINHAGKMTKVIAQMLKASQRAFNEAACNAGTGSVYKVPAGYHTAAISAAMSASTTRDDDSFTNSALRNAHSALLRHLRDTLSRNGANIPNFFHDANPEQKALLTRVASNYGVPVGMLLAMLRTPDGADPVGAKMGQAIREVVDQLGDKDSPVDEELFGKTLTNSTTVKSNVVNDEASKAVEEEYVAYLSHNSARPTINVRRPNKADAASYGRHAASAIKSRNRAVITSIKNALQFQNDKRVGEVHGLLSGDLDEGGLHKLRYDSEHIWSQKTLTNLPDVAVGILVDQSGSMASGNKIVQAQETCIVLAEALKQINGMHLHIYGHTANQTGRSDLTLFEHYSSYGDASSADLSNLGLIQAHSNNYDGYAIKEAAQRLNQDPAKKKYLFVIADGQPAGSGYSGKEAEKHVTSVCTYVRKKLQIATYAFAVGAFNRETEKKFREQYGADNVVFISTVKAALPKIVRFLRNALQKEKRLSNATTT